MAPVDRLGGAIFVLFLASQVGMIIIVNSYFAEFGPGEGCADLPACWLVEAG